MNGIILAGGENRRMGADKAFLQIDGRPMIEHILALFSGLFKKTIIVTNTPERYRSYKAELVGDALATRGPLTGIYSGLQRSGEEYNFIAACDMPFLDHRLIAYMREVSGGHDAVVPLVNGLPEPLHAIYSKRTLLAIESHIRSGERRIYPIFDRLDVRYLVEEEISRFDPDNRSFRNINTPEEYKEAVCSD